MGTMIMKVGLLVFIIQKKQKRKFQKQIAEKITECLAQYLGIKELKIGTRAVGWMVVNLGDEALTYFVSFARACTID